MSAAFCLNAAGVTWFRSGTSRSSNRDEALAARAHLKSRPKSAMVFAGDAVLPSIYATPKSRTTLTFVNLTDSDATFTLRFLEASGADLYVPIVDIGTVRGGRFKMAPNERFEVKTEFSAEEKDGWALLNTDDIDYCIGSETTVEFGYEGGSIFVNIPTWNKYNNRQVFPFSNREGRLSFGSIINATVLASTVTVKVRDDKGVIANTETFTLEPYSAATVNLVEAYPFLADKTGVVEIEASDFGVAAGSLSIIGNSVVSVQALSNPHWL